VNDESFRSRLVTLFLARHAVMEEFDSGSGRFVVALLGSHQRLGFLESFSLAFWGEYLALPEEDQSLYGAVITFIRLLYAAGKKQNKTNPEIPGKLLVHVEIDSKELYLNTS